MHCKHERARNLLFILFLSMGFAVKEKGEKVPSNATECAFSLVFLFTFFFEAFEFKNSKRSEIKRNKIKGADKSLFSPSDRIHPYNLNKINPKISNGTWLDLTYTMLVCFLSFVCSSEIKWKKPNSCFSSPAFVGIQLIFLFHLINSCDSG